MAKNCPWLLVDKANISSALCATCNSKLNVESGIFVIQHHEKQETLLKSNEELEPSRVTFSSHGQDFLLIGRCGRAVLSSEQQAWNAVTACCINVDNNIHFLLSENVL